MDSGPGERQEQRALKKYGTWFENLCRGITQTLASLRAASSDPKCKMKKKKKKVSDEANGMRSNLDVQMFVCACARGSVCACSCVYVCAQANGKTWPISIVGVGLWRKRKTAIRFMPTIGNTIIKIILRVLTGMLTNSPIQHYKEPPPPPYSPTQLAR